MFILIESPPGLEIIARWGPLPIGMALRSEGSLKWEMLSLARRSKYVNNTQQVIRGQLIVCSDTCKLIFMLYDKIVPMRNQL